VFRISVKIYLSCHIYLFIFMSYHVIFVVVIRNRVSLCETQEGLMCSRASPTLASQGGGTVGAFNDALVHLGFG
jgi:hypothetical protein